jgi:hypothetical protein
MQGVSCIHFRRGFLGKVEGPAGRSCGRKTDRLACYTGQFAKDRAHGCI